MKYIIYDLESYPNWFTGTFLEGDEMRQFDNPQDVRRYLAYVSRTKQYLVGFNNVNYDGPMCEYLVRHPDATAKELFDYGQRLIEMEYPPRQAQHLKQVDLYKIHHFDNKAKMTSLKMLEFVMRMDDIQELPFEVGSYLSYDESRVLLAYNAHDVKATAMFLRESKAAIEFRQGLGGGEWLNYNDGKIGKEYFRQELEKHGIGWGQSIRDSIALGDVVLPYIKFKNAEFCRVLDFFRGAVISQTKGVFKGLSAVIDGFQYDFGVGGIHGSRQGVFVSDDDYVIYDWDVASYYPNLAIANRFYPEHLGEEFCDIYEDVYNQRRGYAKGTPENAMLKLALNSVYGDSNNQYSMFYDPKYTMAITINGQLLLCMLAEWLGMDMIQINTDGLTVRCRRDHVDEMKAICAKWEKKTGLTLESAIYSHMYVRDVNNYVAIYEGGGVKLKGAYAYNREWHQNHSMLVVPKAVEAHLVHGADVEEFIRGHKDVMDFMLYAKVRRCDRLLWDGKEVQRLSRYYVSESGYKLQKEMPGLVRTWYRYPKPTKVLPGKCGDIIYEGDTILVRTTAARKRLGNEIEHFTAVGPVRKSIIAGGQKVILQNKVDRVLDINYDFYINEANKLLEAFK